MTFFYYFAVAILNLEMDDIVGQTLVGSISGTVQGGASVIPGKIGHALHIDGSPQYVTYGPRGSDCYANPDMCTNGLTYSLWIQLLTLGNTVIIDTGSFRGHRGLSLRSSFGIMKLSIKTGTINYKFEGNEWATGRWFHVVFTWSPSNGIDVFVNGCHVEGDLKNKPLAIEDGFLPFILGANTNLNFNARMYLDHLLVWDEWLTSDDVWQLYVQGGTI